MKGERWLQYGGPIALFVVLISAWEIAVHVFKVPQMILPAPGQVVDALIDGFRRGIFQKHLLVTGQEVLVGYVLGVTLGVALGAPIALSRTVELVRDPYLLALQSMPKIALAPLMMIWVGFGIESKIIITMIVAIFPVLVNVVVGLRARYGKKLVGPGTFTFEDVAGMRAAVERAAASDEPQALTARSTGRDAAGDVVAEFEVDWSFKRRGR